MWNIWTACWGKKIHNKNLANDKHKIFTFTRQLLWIEINIQKKGPVRLQHLWLEWKMSRRNSKLKLMIIILPQTHYSQGSYLFSLQMMGNPNRIKLQTIVRQSLSVGISSSFWKQNVMMVLWAKSVFLCCPRQFCRFESNKQLEDDCNQPFSGISETSK